MTKLEEVLAETWVHIGDGYMGRELAPNYQPAIGRLDTDRAAVAVLGKRALALVLKHEWRRSTREVNDGEDASGRIHWDELTSYVCSECEADRDLDDGKHTEGCEWGAICDEARRLG